MPVIQFDLYATGMANKRIVPKPRESESNLVQFRDGPRSILASEASFLTVNCVELTGKRREKLTYREWLDQVVTRVSQSQIFQGEVKRQLSGHFAGVYGLG